MAKYEGGCACGKVKFSTDAEPMMAGHCQCRHCQQLSGAGHTTFAAFTADSIQMSGEVKYWDYMADSGNTATRGHCPNCGSQLFAKSTGMNGVLAVQLAAMKDSSKVKPAMVFFNGKEQPWDNLDASMPRFPGMPPI